MDFEISPKEALAQLESDSNCVLLDVRRPEEYALVHLPNAVLLPLQELEERVNQLEAYRTRTVLVYCHHGVRSLRATLWLREQGFEHVRSVSGGIDAWAAQLDPTLGRY